MLVLVNPAANGGKGRARWGKAEPALRARGVEFEARETASAEEAEALARAAAEANDGRCVVAAGGDGTVNLVLNALFDPATDALRGDVVLGAVGLGSSNDFHKPFADERFVAGLPARVDVGAARAVDVGKAAVVLPDGERRTRYFLLNASMGYVADGNAFFNTGETFLRWLKRLNVELAIVYSALRTLAKLRPLELRLTLDDAPPEELVLTALGILKQVHFAGGMRYDTPVQADDGLFDVCGWEAMPRRKVLGTVAALYQGKFSGRPGARTWRAARVGLEPKEPAPLELDGEVGLARSAVLSVLPRALRVCG